MLRKRCLKLQVSKFLLVLDSYIGAINQRLIAPDNYIYDVASRNLQLNVFLDNSIVKAIRSEVTTLTDSIIYYNQNFKTTSSYDYYKTDTFTVEFFTSNSVNQQSILNSPLLIMNNCIDSLRIYYNITKEQEIPIQKISWNNVTQSDNSNLTVLSDLNYNFYHPITGEKLDITDVCKQSSTQLRTPVDINSLNLTLIDNFQPKKINLYDTEDSFYQSVCVTYVNDTSDSDVTINQRRERVFPGISFKCSDGCTFTGFDENYNQVCDCRSVNATVTAVDVTPLSGIQYSNIKVVGCFPEAFNTNLKSNPGFYVNGIVMVALVIAIFFYSFFSPNPINTHFKEVFKHDAVAFGVKNEIYKVRKLDYNYFIFIAVEVGKPHPNDVDPSNPIQNQPEKEKNISSQEDPVAIYDQNIQIKNRESKAPLTNDVFLDNNQITVKQKTSDVLIPLDPPSDGKLILSNPSNRSGKDDNEEKSLKSQEQSKNEPEKSENGLISQLEEKADFTLGDYAKMTVQEELKYDKRSFWQYYKDIMFSTHIILVAFFTKANKLPVFIRLTQLLFFISFQFALNAMFYTDDFISQKNDLPKVLNNFEYTIKYQISKSIWSLLIGTLVPLIVLKLTLYTPKTVYEKYNLGLLSLDKEISIQAYIQYVKSMWWRYTIFIVCVSLIHLFSWYFVTVFCGVYIKSSINWFYGGIITLFIKFFVSQPLMAIIKTIFRIFVHIYPTK